MSSMCNAINPNAMRSRWAALGAFALLILSVYQCGEGPVATGHQEPVLAARSLVFVLDLSGSMDDAAGDGRTRLEAAKTALAQVLAQAPTNGSHEYALTTFGGGCDVEVPIDFTGFTDDPQRVVDYSAGLYADGSTPLAEALQRGQHLALDEASSEDILLVLLSDGEETCSGDPVGGAGLIEQGVWAKANAATGTLAKVISVNAIGFGVAQGSNADQQIQAIAKESGGNYFRASKTADLAAALGQASGLSQTRVPTLSGQVTDAEGHPIQGALVQLRDLRENTDANGRYLFPNNAGVQGVDSLIVTAAGYVRFEAEVYLFDVDKEFDVELMFDAFDAATFPVAAASVESGVVEPGDQVTLWGNESSDPAGGRLTYHWSQLPGNPFPVSFSHNDSESAFAVRATLTDLGIYQFVLEVENEAGLRSMPDTVAVRVMEGLFSLPGGALMEFVWIPAGTFRMGAPSSEAGSRSDEALHEVEISRGFWLGRYEVTQGQWEAVMGTSPWSGRDHVVSDLSHPAVSISWNAVQRFIGRLNAAAGDSLYRLPSEAEWEYACRAGSRTRWSFGDDESVLGNYAWYWDNAWDVGEEYAHAVGTKWPNAWGLYDMHGNVYEWVQDWYGSDYYDVSPRVDPRGPSSGSFRVGRGGSFGDSASDLRSADRSGFSPGGRGDDIGVRLLRIYNP